MSYRVGDLVWVYSHRSLVTLPIGNFYTNGIFECSDIDSILFRKSDHAQPSFLDAGARIHLNEDQ